MLLSDHPLHSQDMWDYIEITVDDVESPLC